MVKHLKSVSRFLVIFLMVLFTSLSYAQPNGIIIGKVIDSESGDYLPSANIMLLGTDIGTATDKNGSYRIVNVPPGSYTLLTRYMGYKPDSISIAVKSGTTIEVDIKLTVSYIKLEDVVVSGLRQGQLKALNMQRESNTIENVVSRELLESFPDVNAADVIKRVPGVFVDRSEGEGRYVLIRGTEPRLTTITVDGQPLATNRNQQNYTQMDIISSNQMGMLQVIKALTPDMDVNSIGGSVNIISRSAFDYPGMNLKVTAGSGYSNLGAQPLYQGDINYSTMFGENEEWGFSFSANYDQRNFWQDDNEISWDQVEDINDNVIPYAITEMDLADLQWRKYRYGVGGSFEFRPDDNNKFFARIMWNELDDDEVRARTRVRVDRGDYLTPDGLLTQRSRIVRESKARLEKQNQTNLSFGGENHFGDLSLDYNFGYSYGNGNRKPEITSTWDLDTRVNLALDISSQLYPKYSVTNTPPPDQDPSRYETSGFNYRNFNASNKYWVGGLNVKYPYEFMGYPATVKAGGKYTRVYKDNGDTYTSYDWIGPNALTMDQFLSTRQRNDFMNDNYVFGPEPDPKAIKGFLLENRDNSELFSTGLSIWDAEGQTYNVTENVMAYYLMSDIKFGDFSLLAGFRHEFTSDDYNGNVLIYDTEGDFSSLTPVSDTKKYNDLFPMVHFVYDFDQFTKVRLAFTRSMSRPNYWDLVPYTYLRDRNQDIRSGNPDLVPTYSYNFDFIAAHYFSGIGIASVSFFYKSLKDIIFDQVSIIQSGTYAGYEIEQMINGGSADLYGIELNWQQELTFLPGFLSGFGIFANYTHTWAKADLVGREGFLPGQAGDIGNLALSYEMGGFQARLSYSLQGKFITEVGIDKGFDYYSAYHGQLDFSASQKIFKPLELYLEVVNITNEPQREYMGDPSRPSNISFFSWWSRVGVKYSL